MLTADTAAAVSAVRFQLLDEACLGATHRFATNGESYRVEGIADALLAAARASHRLRIDITMQSAASTVGFVPIVSFAKRADCGNFLLGQSGNTLVLRLRTNTAAQSPPRLFEVALAEINQDVHHLVVSYSSARLTVAVDDKELGCLRELTGGFSNWTPQPLFLGNPANGVSWNGTLNSIVLETEF